MKDKKLEENHAVIDLTIFEYHERENFAYAGSPIDKLLSVSKLFEVAVVNIEVLGKIFFIF